MKENAFKNAMLQPEVKSVKGKIKFPHLDVFRVLVVPDILNCQAGDNYTHMYLKAKRYSWARR